MNPDTFANIAESLRAYRRADLRDFEASVPNAIETLYVDALPGDAVLKTALSGNTTFLVGRRGTGKSTVFARAQAEIRKKQDLISIYLDVKAMYDLLAANQTPVSLTSSDQLSESLLRAHLVRKHFLSTVVSDIVSEVKATADSLKLWDRWTGGGRKYTEVVKALTELGDRINKVKLSEEEIPILRLIDGKTKAREQTKKESRTKSTGSLNGSASGLSAAGSRTSDELEEALADHEVYTTYSDAVLRSFPFAALIKEIRDLLAHAGLKRLVIFLDDFSELSWVDQQLFVDVVLSPLNNSSMEAIKLKIAAYPGRIYYGRIDPSKVDTLTLDFSVLYKAPDIQTAEQSAVDYTGRLLDRRFKAFGEAFETYLDNSYPTSEYVRLIFETTFNVPRLMGYILHSLYLDRVSKGLAITPQSVRLASHKYYETVILRYFDRMTRYALEPFDKKLDRHNQHALLRVIIEEARAVKRRIAAGEVGGTYFEGLHNPPVSHFSVSPSLERVLSALELNFLVTKYHEMRNKDGDDVYVYALHYGLCEAERFPWGYPRGRRDDRSYFVQRAFDYSRAIHQFLVKNQTIRCSNCGSCHSMDQKDKFEFYHWRCPECREGHCQVVNLGEEFESEVKQLNYDIMLDPVELDILSTLYDEDKPMRAGEISKLLDTTHQLVGKRTEKLQELDLVSKEKNEGVMRSTITKRATEIYFAEEAAS